MDDFWIWLIVCVLLVGCLFGGAIAYERAQCFSKAGGMGFDIQWSIMGGCKIEVETGKWIPLESYYFKQE